MLMNLDFPRSRLLLRSVLKMTIRKTSYERLFKQWGLRKNRKGADWNWVGHRVHHRQAQGRPRSALYIKGERIPEETIRKEVSRHVSALQQASYASTTG